MAVDSLQAQGVDIIVGITHQRVDADAALLHAEER
jgi:hypothetical protein